MYNHYIPQSDGSFRRNPVPEQPRRQPSRPAPQPKSPPPPPKKPEPEPAPDPCPPPKEEQPPCHQEHHAGQSPLDFLKKLLPRDLDSADLVIIALLLLLSGEGCDDDMAPLLTIALYFLL